MEQDSAVHDGVTAPIGTSVANSLGELQAMGLELLNIRLSKEGANTAHV